MQEDPRYQFGYRFVSLARRWRRRLDQELTRSGLTDASWSPLLHLFKGGDGVTQAELAERIGLESSSLVRLIDILEGRGFVQRQTDLADRRARRLVLTPSGRAEVEAILVRVQAWEAKLLEGISEAQILQTLQLFDEIDRRL